MPLTVRIAREDFATATSSAPKVLFFDEASARSLGDDLGGGVCAIVVRRDAGGFVFSVPDGSKAEDEAALVEICEPPTGCIAIVGKDEASLASLSEWWRHRDGESPAVVAERGGAAGRSALLATLCRRLAAEVTQQARFGVGALSSLARLREEYEEVREAMAQLDRHLSGRRIGELTLVSEYPQGAARFEAQEHPGLSSIRQPLDVPGRQLAAVAVHLAGIGRNAEGSLRVRLLAMETQRVLGSWRIPADQIAAGWLRLELPLPVQAFAQSVALDLDLGELTDPPSLSLFDGVWDETQHVVDGSGRAFPFMLSHRAWTADPGSWYVYPRFWDLHDANRALPLTAVSFQFSDDAWRRVRKLDIGGVSVADSADSRFLTCPVPGGMAGLQWPGLAIPHGDQLTFATRLLDAKAPPIDVAVLVAVAGEAVSFDEPLEPPPTMAFSEWKSFGPLEDGLVHVWLPPAADRSFDIYLLSRSPSRSSSPFNSWVEWLWCKVSEVEHAPSDSAAPAETAVEPALAVQEDGAGPDTCLFDDVSLIAYFVGAEDHEHITLSLHNLYFQGRKWRRFNFKVTDDAGLPGLEFRLLEGEPPFIVWPSDATDIYGPVYKVSAGVLAPELNPGLAALNPVDRRFLNALARSLPTFLTTLSQNAGAGSGESSLDLEKWSAIARRIASYFDGAARPPRLRLLSVRSADAPASG